jgi:GT2 family glycosyltransferase
LEVVVVDNNSADNTANVLTEKYAHEHRFKLIKSRTNLGAGGGRNLGAKSAKGKYLLFVDSDNIISPKMISNLVDFNSQKADCGLVGPLMLYKSNPKIIWLYSADINMFTSQAKYLGTGEKDLGQYPEIVSVGHLPNCFMLLRSDFTKIKGFEEKYLVVYEEADLAEKIKRLGKKIYLYTKAVTYHDIELPKPDAPKELGFRSKERAYLLARNRILFMKRNASLPQKIFFFIIFNPLILFYYQFNLLFHGQFDKAWYYLRGSFAGFTR